MYKGLFVFLCSSLDKATRRWDHHQHGDVLCIGVTAEHQEAAARLQEELAGEEGAGAGGAVGMLLLTDPTEGAVMAGAVVMSSAGFQA